MRTWVVATRTIVTDERDTFAFAAGRLFFSRDGSLFSQPFDPVAGALSGEPVRIVDDVGRSGGASRKWTSISRAPASRSSNTFMPVASAMGSPTADHSE